MSVEVVRAIEQIRERVALCRAAGRSIGFVPTMGALHDGHGRLIDEARNECGAVVVSIFVNPTQFNQAADFEAYPRVLEEDVAFCGRRGVDLVFTPTVEEMYPAEAATFVEVSRLTDHLCGAFRPGHFRGVATIVTKLFNIVRPDRAYFGEKDVQQLAVVSRLVRDLDLPIAIVGVPTVREPDGLALSSRNRRLSAEERRLALALIGALEVAARAIAAGERDARVVKEAAVASIPLHPAVRLEYLEIVHPDDMQPVSRIAGPVRIAGAMWVGNTRLIDNLPGDRD